MPFLKTVSRLYIFEHKTNCLFFKFTYIWKYMTVYTSLHATVPTIFLRYVHLSMLLTVKENIVMQPARRRRFTGFEKSVKSLTHIRKAWQTKASV